MRPEFFQLSDRIGTLEVRHGEFSVMQKHTNTKLEILEKLITDNQTSLTSINLQLITRKERVKTLKSALVTLSAITATVSSLHFEFIKAILHTWLS